VLCSIMHPLVGRILSALLEAPIFGDDAMVFKGADGGPLVPSHSVHSSLDWPEHEPEREVINVGIYLDDAGPHNGCLRVVPGSHVLPADEVRALIDLGMDNPAFVDVPIDAGDVLLHSEWLVHSSLATPAGSPLRRVLYVAFKNLREYVGADDEHGALIYARMARAAERRAATPYGSATDAAWFAVRDEWASALREVDQAALSRLAPEPLASPHGE
jgi:ectoine hydroxylase-related dioxygenase (phytanoyl-CoA dioxygenase family)